MAQSASKTCEICVSAPSSSYCLDCEQCFCDNCKLLHSRQKISANHEFKETSEDIPEIKSKCTIHNEVFTFVCKECDVPVCACCVTGKHDGHKFSQLKDTITDLKTKIEQEILTKLIKTSGNVSKLKQNFSSFNDQVETVIRSMTEERKKVKRMVDQYTSKRIASLKDKSRKVSERLTVILFDHTDASNEAHALDRRKEGLFDQSRLDATLLRMLKNLKKDIDQLDVCPLPEFPSATYIPRLINENNISQLLGVWEINETKIWTERKCELFPEATVMGRLDAEI